MSDNQANTWQLPKAYDPVPTEEKWRLFWEEKNLFNVQAPCGKTPYFLIMPPPNVTGALHMGHALVSTLQDVLTRFHRMQGFDTLWIPGLDHAGISTQTVVERHLMARSGKRRIDHSREEFLKEVWQWKQTYGGRIVEQLKALGCSCDWSALRFTMDEKSNAAVRTAFKRLFDQGLIYRGDYLVNWDTVTQTALADDEVEYETRDSFLWHFSYPLEDGSQNLVIATTRPETMLGDAAVAVHPEDERFVHLIGKNIRLPLTHRLIPIIADSYVDPSFGSGAVKITPAHDFNDYQIGQRHGLPLINILTPDGLLNKEMGRFAGLPVLQARQAVIEAMKELNLLIKCEPHTHRVGVSYRSKAVIEPYLSKQWFIKMHLFRQRLRQVVEDGSVSLMPQAWKSTYFHWIDNLRDWCISRQLWWGHRIPIWHNVHTGDMICFDQEGLPPEVAAAPSEWKQDEDVLDTWFSSALWPFSTLGWPEKTDLLQRFYPARVLITGHDILFFWVARMIFMGDYLMQKPPFPKVYLHGLIYGKSYWRELETGGIQYVDASEREKYDMGQAPAAEVHSRWEKMSKSKGNIIDPVTIGAKYGYDAMRMALCASASQQPQIDIDLRRFEEFKNFANKIWNGSRFALQHILSANLNFSQGLDMARLALEDRWILHALQKACCLVKTQIEQFSFDQAAMAAYDFFWKELCAYYLEIAKPVLFEKRGHLQDRQQKCQILAIVLSAAIRLMHPMAPFITEEVFALLKKALPPCPLPPSDPWTKECAQAMEATCCSTSAFPCWPPIENGAQIAQEFQFLCDIIYAVRNLRGQMRLLPGMRCDLYLIGEQSAYGLAKDNAHILSALLPLQGLHFQTQDDLKGFFGSAVCHGIKICLPLPRELAALEKARLEKENQRLQESVEKSEQQLNNPEFVKRAPPHILQKFQQQLAQARSEQMVILEKLAQCEL